jgi:hypothetical protein
MKPMSPTVVVDNPKLETNAEIDEDEDGLKESHIPSDSTT